MAIYEGSRYQSTPLVERGEVEVFEIRKRKEFSLESSIVHEYIEGETLDILAYRYYGDSQLFWVILDANRRYDSELSIEYGDELLIPSYEEVVNIHE